MDILTDIVRLMRPQAVHWRPLRAQGRWGLSVPFNPLPRFVLVVAGQTWCATAAGESFLMRQGDYLLMTASPRYTLASDLETVQRLEAMADHVGGNEYARWDEGSGGDVLRLVGGYFQIADEHVPLLTELLPNRLLIRSADEKAGRLSRLVELIGEEAMTDAPGRDLVLGRLVEVMLVEILRRPLDQAGARGSGWLSGMADPQIRHALHQIHADVARHWTVDLLAKLSGMSRASFASRFAERVGVAPATYIANWRIALAKDALLNSRRPISEIALAIGYLSDSAFSTAFSRSVGVPPAAYRKRGRA